MTAIPYIIIVIVFAVSCFIGNGIEYIKYSALAFGIVLVLTGIVHYLMLRKRRTATEYLGGIIDTVSHHEEWDERQEYTVEVEDGNDSDGRTSSHSETRVRYIRHPEQWWVSTNIGTKHQTTENSFNKIIATWNTPMKEIKITGYDINGGVRNGQEYYYNDVLTRENGNPNPIFNQELVKHTFSVTEPHTYINKVQNSNSIFRFETITDDKAQQLGLHPYPAIEHLDQSPVLGKSVDNDTMEIVKIFNAYYGSQRQIRLFVHLFDASQGIETAVKQQAFWRGGNKNEFSVCLGLDGNTVKWCYTFSWMDEPTLGRKTEDYFHQHPELDLRAYVLWLAENIDLWKRKEFADFRNLRIQLSHTQTAGLIALCVALCAAAFCLIQLLL
ncbi:MAG: hypothetical protein ACI4AH_04785 [Muribaculaceae bacterium]